MVEIEEFDVTPEDLDSTRKCERGVYVYRVTEGEFVAARTLEEAIAFHQQTFHSDLDDMDFAAEPEDLDDLVHDEDGHGESLRSMILEELAAGGAIPFVARRWSSRAMARRRTHGGRWTPIRRSGKRYRRRSRMRIVVRLDCSRAIAQLNELTRAFERLSQALGAAKAAASL